MHGITNYALEATEYKQSSRSEPNEKDYNEPDWINVPRSLGAKFELDEELLKVVEAIDEQKDYIEKKKLFENLTEFEALAYVDMIGRRKVAKQHSAVTAPLSKTVLADMSKRGMGPTFRSLQAATDLDLTEMMNAVGYGSKSFYEIINDINETELPDAIILTVQDIINRHPETINFIDRSTRSRKKIGRNNIFMDREVHLSDFGDTWLGMDQLGDSIIAHLGDYTYRMTPTYSWHSDYDQIDDHESGCHGWDVSITTDNDNSTVLEMFFVSETSDMVLRSSRMEDDVQASVELVKLFRELIRIRNSLDIVFHSATTKHHITCFRYKKHL
jgi:predicted DNA-binding transcriptional regulator AlpA